MKSPLLFSALLLSTFAFAQQHVRHCTTHDRYVQRIQQDPSIVARRAQLEEATARWISDNGNTQTIYVTVPVVVHVLYQNSTQNISAAQIQTQIDVLNEDYSRMNADAANTPAAFQGVAADCEIQFCLATTDPSGNPTTGIERRSVSVSQIGNGNNYYSTAAGGLDIWDHNKYLNFWICDIDGGFTLGYTYLPGTTGASDDGVVIDWNFFGTIGTVAPPFDLGRTATHEVGHWFNLEHIWADEPNCNADDGVTDTPQQKQENYGCPNYPETAERCSTSDPSSMFMNYMDYSDDACMNMFTAGQKARMLAAINGIRVSLLTSNGCGPQGISTYSAALPVSVFPNPSNGQFDLQFASTQKNVEVIITNSIGEEVYHASFMNKEKLSIDLDELAQGVYVAEIITAEARATRKIMIQ